MILGAPAVDIGKYVGIVNMLALIWVAVQQRVGRLRAQSTERKVEEKAVEVAQNIATKSDIDAIKTLLNGQRLALLKERADYLCTIADLRNGPGDLENYERAVREYHELKQAQAIVYEKAIRHQIDELGEPKFPRRGD